MKRPAKVTVILSNRLVRYAIIPFDPQVSGVEEDLALARFHFTRVYGEAAKGWDIRLGESAQGAPRLACAVDAGVVDAVRESFAGGKAKLVSVQPWLMAAYNRRRAEIPKEGAWLALLEAGRACVGFVSAAGWQWVRSLRPDDGLDGAALVERERLRAGASFPPLAFVEQA